MKKIKNWSKVVRAKTGSVALGR